MLREPAALIQASPDTAHVRTGHKPVGFAPVRSQTKADHQNDQEYSRTRLEDIAYRFTADGLTQFLVKENLYEFGSLCARLR